MRYALIADIHGNLEALETVLAEIRKENIDEIISLGDLVGYYPNPNECITLIKENAKKSITGNHDYAALGKMDYHNAFTFYACISMEWTQRHLSDESREYLSSLPLTAKIDHTVLLTHSTPARPDKWDYIFMDSDEMVTDAFSSFKQRICFNAHTHFPVIMTLRNDQVILHRANKVKLSHEGQYLINVGSVGQPRDGDSRACYTVYDSHRMEVYIKRVKYNYKVTQKRCREENLPEFLALRLAEGR
jgi:predicted phosphodiesterase